MIFSRLRKKFGKYLLNRKLHKIERIIRSVNLKDAKSIGIVFNSRDNLSLKIAKDFMNEHRAKGIKVEIIGFSHKRKVDETHISNDYMNFIYPSDFTYFYQPKSAVVKGFIEKPFDVLLAFYPKDHLQIRMITCLSKATLKVGNARIDHHSFDLAIESEPAEVEEMFTNALLYLKKLTTTITPQLES